MGSADSPLAVHCLYSGRDHQRGRSGNEEVYGRVGTHGGVRARLAFFERDVLVRAAVCRQVAQGATHMKRPVAAESASRLIDERIKELGDWRGRMLAKVRAIVHEADPEIVEEWKWGWTPVFSHGGIVCTGETYKDHVKMTFAKGASLKDPAGLFNSSLDGNVRRAIDIHEGDEVDEAALKDLIRAAVALNLMKRPRKTAAVSKHSRATRHPG